MSLPPHLGLYVLNLWTMGRDYHPVPHAECLRYRSSSEASLEWAWFELGTIRPVLIHFSAGLKSQGSFPNAEMFPGTLGLEMIHQCQ